MSVPWRLADGGAVSCEEKVRVLNENLAEIQQVCQDAFEDALIMGCEEQQLRDAFVAVIQSLRNPMAK
ncbi:MAG: hypothetical protein H6905_11410 [Hyphomicrobiales bacterium]|nr:hypothetical protein [Hyphomicrobiales bacterium]